MSFELGQYFFTTYLASMMQGEALVPEGIVRFGSRAEGREHVQTIKAEDERIK